MTKSHTWRALVWTAIAAAALIVASVPSAYAQDPAPSGASSTVRTSALMSIRSASGAKTDRIIVKYRAPSLHTGVPNTGASADTEVMSRMQTLNTAAGEPLAFVRAMDNGAYVLRLGARKPLEQVQALSQRLAALAGVAYAEPDRLAFPTLGPNDPLFSSQWHLTAPDNTTFGINMPHAWDITTGSQALTIAIIDTGFRNHADFAGRIVPGYDFISDPLVANDGDGRDADPSDPGDWITAAESASGYFAGCLAENSSWHGTHVTGIIGANGNNGIGVAGINWQSKLLPVRVLGKCGGYASDIADGIRWAAGLSVTGAPANANPARVLNMSLGGPGPCATIYQDAIDAATAAGAIIVVAAGNENADVNTSQPANCNNVIAVAATNRSGDRASYSNSGSGVAIAAPGGEGGGSAQTAILSTLNTGLTTPGSDSYESYAGTSMATPQVAGIISLMLAVKPTLTFAQVLSLLRSSATTFPAGSSCTITICGAGIVNGAAAVQAASAFGVPTVTRTPVPGGAAPNATSTTAATPTRLPSVTVTPKPTVTATATVGPGTTPSPSPIPTATSSRPTRPRAYLPVIVR